MKRWAFIYTLGPEATEVSRSDIGSPDCVLLAVGVPGTAAAATVVDALVDDGVELIELCGAFGPAETAAVQAVLRDRVPLGAVTYPASAAGGLHLLFG